MAQLLSDAVTLTESQQLVQTSVRDVCSNFDHQYWRNQAEAGDYPREFVDTLVDHGWMGVLIPEAYGGAGMGTQETVVMMEEIAANGGGFSAAQAVHGGVYNSVPIVEYASEELKRDLLPRVADGEASIQAFGLTEPNAGSNSTAIETRAESDGDEYVINGQKIWTSRVDVSDYIVLVARTTPLEDVDKRTRGISMFLVDIDDAIEQGALEMEAIPKSASDFVHSFELWFDDLRVPAENLIGVEGEGSIRCWTASTRNGSSLPPSASGWVGWRSSGRLTTPTSERYSTARSVRIRRSSTRSRRHTRGCRRPSN